MRQSVTVVLLARVGQVPSSLGVVLDPLFRPTENKKRWHLAHEGKEVSAARI